jgi:hypothetical protein
MFMNLEQGDEWVQQMKEVTLIHFFEKLELWESQ